MNAARIDVCCHPIWNIEVKVVHLRGFRGREGRACWHARRGGDRRQSRHIDVWPLDIGVIDQSRDLWFWTPGSALRRKIKVVIGIRLHPVQLHRLKLCAEHFLKLFSRSPDGNAQRTACADHKTACSERMYCTIYFERIRSETLDTAYR